MRKVSTRSLLDYLRPFYSEGVHPAYRKQIYYSGRRIFNPTTLLLAISVESLLLGRRDRRAYCVVGVILALFLGSYLLARMKARFLTIRRIVPGQATQGQEIEVELEVTNGDRSSIRDLIIRDRFTGAEDGQVLVWVGDWIQGKGKWTGRYRRTCDVGMGLHGFKDLSVAFTDPLGIFEITVAEDKEDWLAVYPEPVAIPEMPVEGRRESFAHGRYLTRLRGGSSNFVGLREYTRGDSLRHVSWRASAKAGKLLVKEFESVANTDVSIYLDLNAIRHAGTELQSSWEQAKDAALSILAQQLENGNRVQLLAGEVFVPLGGGPGHLNLIARAIFKLRPVRKAPGEEETQHFAAIPMGSTVVYIGPMLPPIGKLGDSFADVRARLLRMRVRDVQLICLLIDAASFIRKLPLRGVDEATLKALRNSRALVVNEAEVLLYRGAVAYVLEADRKIGASLLTSGLVSESPAPGPPETKAK